MANEYLTIHDEFRQMIMKVQRSKNRIYTIVTDLYLTVHDECKQMYNIKYLLYPIVSQSV